MPLFCLRHKFTHMKKVLVTGANGHLGCNTVRALVQLGHHVRPFVRKTSDLRGLQGLNLDFYYGDVLDKNSLREAATDCEVIVHLAANYKFFARTAAEIMAPAVEGTRNIFEVAAEQGVERMVYTSSVMAVGCALSPDQVRSTEDWVSDTSSVYAVAKRESEQMAWKLADQYQVPLIALLPGSILGRYDYHVTPSNRIIVDMMKGLGITIEMSLPFVDVRDVARIHALAVEKGTVGQRYFICSKAFPMKQVGEIFYAITGRKVPHLPTTRMFNLWVGTKMESFGKLTGWNPPLTRSIAEYFSHRYANYDISRTVADFDFQPASLEEMVRDAINWFHFLGKGKVGKAASHTFIPEATWVK